MEKYRELLKQAFLTDASPNEIARSRNISHNTVRRAVRLAREAKLTIEALNAISDSELRAIIFPQRSRSNKVLPDCAREMEYLARGHNLYEAHARYMSEVGIEKALSYSAFCERMRKHRHGMELVFRHVHQPGFAMQVDFAGYRPVGEEHGLKRKFELFVAVLPASHYIFASLTRKHGSGPMSSMIAPPAPPPRHWSGIGSRPIAAASIRRLSFGRSRACCRPTPMPGSRSSIRATASVRSPAGPMSGARSSTTTPPLGL